MTDEWDHRPSLHGKHVHLEPLGPEHADGLHEAGRDPDIWTWLSLHRPPEPADTRRMVDEILAAPDRISWAQIDAATGKVAGTTSYYELDRKHRGLAIGHTWIGTPWQRTPLNTEAKLLLLRRAFEDLSANRVTWHTDSRNERSRRAIERLGARHEGILRAHRIRKDGTLRDTAVYSVVAAEWPAVREGLAARLD
ncbi:GNAT family N-acetyltransferase [Amycolatopsis nigrescens]|uniref:GNAT family N-acetyltransferase n=1 Tax=Amycolatopsis nigrescens TaxID=381445 RepID=UPI00037F8388|nr:GNAT family protein [Amycolatopsis nigrescens]